MKCRNFISFDCWFHHIGHTETIITHFLPEHTNESWLHKLITDDIWFPAFYTKFHINHSIIVPSSHFQHCVMRFQNLFLKFDSLTNKYSSASYLWNEKEWNQAWNVTMTHSQCNDTRWNGHYVYPNIPRWVGESVIVRYTKILNGHTREQSSRKATSLANADKHLDCVNS